jgi:hypothetical protein
MTLEEIVQLLVQIINTLASMQGVQIKAAVEHQPFLVETAAVTAELAVINPTYGLNAIHSQIAAEAAQSVSDHATIVTMLTVIEGLLAPVHLPPTPPPGYGGGASASDVWAALLNGGQFDAETLLVSAGLRGWREAQLPVVEEVLNKEGWLIGWDVAAGHYVPANPSDVDSLSFAAVLPSDASVQAFVNRILPGNSYLFDLLGRPYKLNQTGNATWLWKYGDIELLEYQAAKFGKLPAGKLAPVWPGLANVTLGAAVSLVDQLHTTAAMSGVIVKLTSVPIKYPKFDFGGGVASYRYLGSITFETDAGEHETVDLLGLNDCVYVPRTMAVASGVRVHVVPGIIGTIQPWITT